MRMLFASLVLCNALLFGWFMSNDGQTVQGPPRPGPGSLTLLSEVQTYDGPCFHSARLVRESDALALAQRYETGSRIIAEEDQRPVGYWVYLPPRPSLEAARRDMARLEELGVTDVGLVSHSDMANAVALGVYSSRERAERRRIAIADLGFPAQMDQRIRTRTYYRVVVEAPSPPEGSGVDWEEVDCQQAESDLTSSS